MQHVLFSIFETDSDRVSLLEWRMEVDEHSACTQKEKGPSTCAVASVRLGGIIIIVINKRL